MMGPGFVPWHVKLEYYFYCHCTNLTNCTEVKMCCYSPKQGNKDSIVFGAEHLLVSHTYSHNHVILGCLYLIWQSEQRKKSKSHVKDEHNYFHCFLLSTHTDSLGLLWLWLSLLSEGEAITSTWIVDKGWSNSLFEWISCNQLTQNCA